MQREAESGTPIGGAIIGLGSVAVICYIILLLYMMGTTTFDIWGGVLLAPILVGITLPAMRKEAARQQDPRIFWILFAALVLKLLGGVIRRAVAYAVYGGPADAAGYHNVGVEYAERFWDGDFTLIETPLTRTTFIEFFTGVVYFVIGPSELGGFIFYSWMGFMGLLALNRAFMIAVPDANKWLFMVLLFFLPSMLYWPSSIGKEAWMMCTVGIAVLGIAKMFMHRAVVGFVIALAGTWATAIVRPHVAAIIGVALASAFLFRRPSDNWGQLRIFARIGGIVVVVALAFLAVGNTERFLKDAGIGENGGVTDALEFTTERSSQGGSEFDPVTLTSPHRAPIALITVIYRPLIHEAMSGQMLVAGLEGTLLFLLSMWRFRSWLTAFRWAPRSPFLVFAFSYIALFVFGFSSIANFGILARQRVQVLPFVLLLLVIYPRKRVKKEDDGGAGVDEYLIELPPASEEREHQFA